MSVRHHPGGKYRDTRLGLSILELLLLALEFGLEPSDLFLRLVWTLSDGISCLGLDWRPPLHLVWIPVGDWSIQLAIPSGCLSWVLERDWCGLIRRALGSLWDWIVLLGLHEPLLDEVGGELEAEHDLEVGSRMAVPRRPL